MVVKFFEILFVSAEGVVNILLHLTNILVLGNLLPLKSPVRCLYLL